MKRYCIDTLKLKIDCMYILYLICKYLYILHSEVTKLLRISVETKNIYAEQIIGKYKFI